MLVVKSHKYRLYPNKCQIQLFEKSFGCVRFYWNNLVATFNSYNKDTNEKPTYKTSTELRQEYTWLNEVSAAILQQKKRDFDQTKTQYFSKSRKSKVGRMKFKKKNISNNSFRLPNQKFSLDGSNKIKLEKIGKISIVIDREIPSEAKLLSVTISKNSSNQYFASINFEVNQETKIKKSNENIGIDLGLKELATLSNGIQFANPKMFRESQSKLRSAQKHLSRKTKDSNRYKKQKLKVAKIHQKVVNQREWYLHNVSKFIVENFNEIAMEDLCVSGMIKNRKLSKSIADTSMSKLKGMIVYKQKDYGKEVKFLGRFEASTKECSCCGNKQDMKLSDRIFVCKVCGLTMDRDLQASIVIRNKVVGVDTTERTWSDDKTNSLHESVKWQLLRNV